MDTNRSRWLLRSLRVSARPILTAIRGGAKAEPAPPLVIAASLDYNVRAFEGKRSRDSSSIQVKGSMMLHHEKPRAPGKSLLILAGVMLLPGILPDPARAEVKKIDSSLGLVPADAAYYSATLRNREQFDAVAKSKAWAKITQLPAYQMALTLLKQQYADPNGKLSPLRDLMEQEENRDLLQLLADAYSDEIFSYGAANWVGFVDLWTQLNRAQQFGPFMQMLKDPTDQKAISMAQVRGMLRVLARNPDKMKAPDFVLGFKIKDDKKAESQIARLETLLNAFVAQEPMLQGRLQRVKIGGGNFLSFHLDGAMVPWDQIPWKDVEEAAGEFDGVVKNLKEMKLTISLGVRDHFLMLSIGSSTDGLKQLGGEGQRLTARPELKPLVRAADKRLTGVSYTSKALRAKAQLSQNDIDSLTVVAGHALDAAGIPADKRQAIMKDVASLAVDLKKNLPDPAASLSFSFLSERGFESFEYQYGRFPELDGSKTLTLLDHVGGDPILAVVGRSKGTLEQYQAFSKWIKVAFGHAEPLLVEKLDKEQKEKYEQISKAVLPLLRRLDEVTGTMLLPALADGQAGFVVDAKWKSKQWQQDMPTSDKALPMLELGVLVGVSDAELLEKAMKSYRKIVEDALVKVKELAPPGEVPSIKIAEAEIKTVKAGKLYVFPLPAEWKLDPQVAPTAGLSKRVGVLALSAGHAERLLTPRPLKIEGGPLLLAGAKRPLAGAAYFNGPAFIDAIAPWVMFGLEQAHIERVLPGAGDEKQAREAVFQQVRTVLDVLKVFRISTSATYIEDGVLITHSETVVRDE
jgi:hypothetical protein